MQTAENGSVHGQCTRLVYTAENGRAHGPYTAVYTRRYGPYTAMYTALVHVDTCTRPHTCRVHGPYMAVYMSRVRGCVRAMYTAEDVRIDGPYTVMYTGGVDV